MRGASSPPERRDMVILISKETLNQTYSSERLKVDGRYPSLDSSPLSLGAEKFSAVNLEARGVHRATRLKEAVESFKPNNEQGGWTRHSQTNNYTKSQETH